MRLVAEMKIPGRLWLQFEVDPGDRDSLVRQTTVFDPAGYVGARLLVPRCIQCITESSAR